MRREEAWAAAPPGRARQREEFTRKRKMLKTTRAPKIKDHHGPDATRALVTARIEELRKAEARNAAKQGKGTAAQRQLAALTKAAAAHLAAR